MTRAREDFRAAAALLAALAEGDLDAVAVILGDGPEHVAGMCPDHDRLAAIAVQLARIALELTVEAGDDPAVRARAALARQLDREAGEQP